MFRYSFRGPAPIHHTLLQRRARTGVTVQTLHPKQFDHGLVIAQTPSPGFQHRCYTVEDLLRLMANKGAEMLIDCIEAGTFVRPVPPDSHLVLVSVCGVGSSLSKAPKITPHDRHVDWSTWTAEDILLKRTIIPSLWSIIRSHATQGSTKKRVVWSAGFTVSDMADYPETAVGRPFVVGLGSYQQAVYIRTCNNQILRILDITIEGKPRDDPVRSAQRAGIFSGDRIGTIKSYGKTFPVHNLWLAELD